jgi:hypothetical protein
MTQRLILTIALCIMLTACWVGKVFYDRSEMVQPIAAGDYLSTEFRDAGQPGKTGRMRVSPGEDGMTRITPLDTGEEPSIMGFAALGPDRKWFIGWMLVEPQSFKPGDEVSYFLLERSDRSFRFFLPTCGDNREMAVAAGAVVVAEKKADLCRFADRNSLESAMSSVRDKLQPSVVLTPAVK